MEITSVNNEKIKELSKLQTKKYRDEKKLFLVEGDHLVNEAYKAGYLKEVFVLNDSKYNFDNIPLTKVSKEVIKKLSEQTSLSDIVGVCAYIEEKITNNNLIILDGIQDPGNLGTIIRSAAAFNYDILLGDNTVDIYNSKVIRSTEGMIFNVNYIKNNIIDFINKNKNYNYFIADMNKGKEIKDLSINKNIAIIMGNEGNGISKEVHDKINKYLYIKQMSKCESLNVGVAASIIMYELGDINE